MRHALPPPPAPPPPWLHTLAANDGHADLTHPFIHSTAASADLAGDGPRLVLALDELVQLAQHWQLAQLLQRCGLVGWAMGEGGGWVEQLDCYSLTWCAHQSNRQRHAQLAASAVLPSTLQHHTDLGASEVHLPGQLAGVPLQRVRLLNGLAINL